MIKENEKSLIYELEKKLKLQSSQLSEKQTQIETLISELPLPAAHFSPKGEVLHTNKAYNQFLGYTKETLPKIVEEHWELFFPKKEYREQIKKEWEKKLNKSVKLKKAIEPMFVKMQAKDKSIKIAQVHTISTGDLAVTIYIDYTETRKYEQQILEANKKFSDSLVYASLIQKVLIPEDKLFEKHFNDFFTIWIPKDTVGGDIYLLNELKSEDECLIMLIDCTGHGVPGALVTMLVKAIEKEIINSILISKEPISTSWILQYFNKSLKKLLKQEENQSNSDVGFDGGIIYYNKKEKLIKYSGAVCSLFYIDKEDKINEIKGNRHSIGYKRSDINYEFKEHSINIEKGMKFYISSDGFLDQNGGEKAFPYGKKRFKELILNNKDKKMSLQKENFLISLKEYQKDNDKNDDISLLAFSI